MELTDANPARLTEFSRGAGCGCKLSADELSLALNAMTAPFPTSPAMLVGPATADDAGVYRIADNLALVQTLDFFTPIVDDAWAWGAIAATNALSDVYAMGGRPITAMNIVGWPRDSLPWDLLGRVLDGASSALADAGCAVVGGHSIDDAEPKFGCSITGLVDPAQMMTNAAGQVGDLLVLTKPLGVGALTTAVKRGLARDGDEAAAITWMTRSNRDASEAATAAGVRCATDITGFGLIGHLRELARASGVSARLVLDDVPFIDGARSLIAAGAVAGGTERNHRDAVGVDWGRASLADQLALCDAQTSGGLLLAAPAPTAAALIERVGPDASWVIGTLDHPTGTATVPPGPWLRVE